MMRRLLDRFRSWLRNPEEINGDNLCPTYLYRWTLLTIPIERARGRKPRNVRVYLHHFVGNDWALDPHDHPKWFLSIGLRGSYVEYTFDKSGEATGRQRWYAPWIRFFRATHIHRIEATNAWTLVIVGPEQRQWGFWLSDGRNGRQSGKYIASLIHDWVDWRSYIVEHGAERKDC